MAKKLNVMLWPSQPPDLEAKTKLKGKWPKNKQDDITQNISRDEPQCQCLCVANLSHYFWSLKKWEVFRPIMIRIALMSQYLWTWLDVTGSILPLPLLYTRKTQIFYVEITSGKWPNILKRLKSATDFKRKRQHFYSARINQTLDTYYEAVRAL